MRSNKIVPSALTALALGATLASCGGVPSGSVATVADDPIAVSSFNDWSKIATRQQGAVPAGQPIPVLTPPDFKECVAAKQVASAKEKEKKTEAQLRSDCQTQFDQTKQQVMQLLITTGWIKGQAALMGIKVSDEAAQKKFNSTKKQAFPTDAAYQKFLKSSGQTQEQLFDRIRVDLLSQEIRDAVIAKAATVTDQEARDYLQKNAAQFGKPETRTYNMILAKDKAKAEEARKALESGKSWQEVAKEYSTDAATKNTGGLVKDAVKGQQDPSLDALVFSSKKGQISEPTKGSFGWYVVEVNNVTPSNTPKFESVKAQIVPQIKAQKQQAALTAFVKSFQDKWKSKTECAKYYIVDLCKNAPKQAAQPGPGTVQQAPEAPQGG